MRICFLTHGVSESRKHLLHLFKGLAGDTVREASSDEVVDLKKENTDLKQAVAELYLRNDWLKKSLTGQDVTLEED